MLIHPIDFEHGAGQLVWSPQWGDRLGNLRAAPPEDLLLQGQGLVEAGYLGLTGWGQAAMQVGLVPGRQRAGFW